MKDYRFLDEVYDDLATTGEWLDARRDQLGLEFETAFFDAVRLARTRPESFALDQSGYRTIRLKRFSAVVYFSVENDVIVIAGVLMGGRSETNLRDRR